MKRTLATRVVAGVAAASTIVALTSCAPTSDDTELSSIRIGVQYFDVNFDPYNYGATMTFAGPLQALFDPLLRYDSTTATYEPWLAEEFDVSDDGLTLTLKLREDVEFVDGEHLDAAGLIEFLDASLGVDTATFTANLATYEPSVNAVDDYTIEIHTTKRIRDEFFLLLAEVGIFSPAVARDPDMSFDEPLGSGAYLIDEIVADSSATFVRNPDYWNPEAYPFDVVEFVLFADPVAQLNALSSGQIDATALPLELVPEAQDQGFAIHEGSGQFRTLFFFDRSGAMVPALGDVRVRQAINMAFDREAIAETLDLGFGRVTSQPFTPLEPTYIDGADDYYSYDPERAKELLAEAGYPDGFELPILSGGASSEAYIATASFEPLIQQSLADIGITVTFEQFPDTTAWADEVRSGRHAAFAHFHYYGFPLLLLNTDGFLTGGAPDPSIADILDRINNGSDEQFAEAAQEFGRHLIEEAWYAPFSSPATVWASDPEVGVTVGNGIPNLRDFQKAG